jgi:transposase-like protein
MQARRNKFKPDFKAKVALEALKGDKSIAELSDDLPGASHADHRVEEATP